MCVCVRVRACVRACVRVCVCGGGGGVNDPSLMVVRTKFAQNLHYAARSNEVAARVMAIQFGVTFTRSILYTFTTNKRVYLSYTH